MKQILVVLFCSALFFVVGCSIGTNVVGPVEVEQGSVVACATIKLDTIGILKKSAATTFNENDFIVELYQGIVDVEITTLLKTDTFDLRTVTSDSLKVSFTNLKRSTTYTICAHHRSDFSHIRWGQQSFTTTTSDTFAVFVQCKALVAIDTLTLVLKGSSVAATACSTSVIAACVVSSPGQSPWQREQRDRFVPGTRDTIKVGGYVTVGKQWDYTVTIWMSTGYFMTGTVRTPVLVAGQNYDLSCVLTQFDGRQTLAKIVMSLDPLGRIKVSVVIP